MPYNLLIIPLIAGYYLLANLELTKYKYHRLDSQRLLLNSAMMALVIVAFTFWLRSYVEANFNETFNSLFKTLKGVFYSTHESMRYMWTMLIGLSVTVVFTEVINLIIRLIPALGRLVGVFSVKWYGNELESLFCDAVVYVFKVQVTLKKQ